MTAILDSRPADVETEETVLATAMASTRWADEIVTSLRPGDFYRGAHATVFRHMVELRRRGDACGPAEIATSLRTADEYQLAGGSVMLARFSEVPVAGRIGGMATRLRSLARLRRLIEAMTLALGEAHNRAADVDAFVDEVEAAIFAAARADSDSLAAHLGDVIDAELARITAVQAGEGSALGIPTGLPSLDALFGGLRPGEVTVIAARPGMGKTAMLVSLLLNVAASNHDDTTQCAFIASLEMGNAAIARRAMSTAAGVNVRRYERGQISGDEYNRFVAGIDHARRLPIWIDDRVRMTPMQLRGHIRRMQAKYDKPKGPDGRKQRVAAVGVDYLQRMGHDTKRKDRFAEVADMVNAVADTAKETNVAVVLLAQLNRENVKRSGGRTRPKMTDLAESGEIEKVAHNILLIDRPEYYEQDKANVPVNIRGLAEVIVDKQREGQTGIVQLAYDADATRFREPTDDERAAWGSGGGEMPKAYAPRKQRARWEGGAS